MKGDFTGELRRRMDEVCLLGPEHPDHQEVLTEVAKAGDWAKQEWLNLHQENEHLRIALCEVALPGGLDPRLMEIPATLKQCANPFRLRQSLVAAIAAMLMIAGLIAVILNWPDAAPVEDSMRHVASLVADDHSSHPELTFKASDPSRITAMLEPNAPFPVRLGIPLKGANLVGGRICKFKEGPLVLTRWQTGGQEISMYQLRCADFGLPPNQPQRELNPTFADERPVSCRVTLWTDDQFAYAMVADVVTEDVKTNPDL